MSEGFVGVDRVARRCKRLGFPFKDKGFLHGLGSLGFGFGLRGQGDWSFECDSDHVEVFSVVRGSRDLKIVKGVLCKPVAKP